MSRKRQSDLAGEHFWRVLTYTAIFVVGVAVALVIRSIPAVAVATAASRRGLEHAERAVAQWEGTSAGGARAAALELNLAEQSFARASEILASQAFAHAIPGVRGVLDAGGALTAGAAAWASGGRELAEALVASDALLDRFGDRSYRGLTDAERTELSGALGILAGHARRAAAAFDAGDAHVARVRCPFLLRRIVDACARDAEDLIPERARNVKANVQDLVHAGDALVAQTLRGTPASALLLFLNNTELRPGGGFLGTYGLVTVANGRVTDFRTDDVYNLDRLVIGTQRIDPPVPLRRHGIVEYWYLRDANWSPDFAVSSKTVLDFYEREGGLGDPGIVIGFTPTLASWLLELVGPVTVQGERFDAKTIADVLEEHVERSYKTKGIPLQRRKDIITPLSEATMDALLSLPMRSWSRVADALVQAAEERQLMAYARDGSLESFFTAVGVDGRIAPIATGEDFLMVVDANLGALKTDPVVERSVRYALRPDERGGYLGTIALRYRNTGTFTWKTTRYRTYTRVYLPAGTTLIGVDGAMAKDRSDAEGLVDQYDEFSGRTTFGAFVSIEPGEERTLTFTVQVAPQVAARLNDGAYALMVQKQLGLPTPTALTVDLDIGTPVRTASPPEVPGAQGDTRYTMTTDLRVDRRFAVEAQRE